MGDFGSECLWSSRTRTVEIHDRSMRQLVEHHEERVASDKFHDFFASLL